MMRIAVLVCFTFLVLTAVAETHHKQSGDERINILRSIRRLQGIQRRSENSPTPGTRRKKYSDALICNSCSFSEFAEFCEYADEMCGQTQICADIWPKSGEKRNFNGCINTQLCSMLKESGDKSYLRIHCCNTDYCNW